jgi:anti-anti-sigma regulatory factor
METHIKCPPEPCLSKKLSETLESLPPEIIRLILDFSLVGIITGSSISKLLKLRKILEERNGQIVLHRVAPKTKNIFTVTKLERAFRFSDW